MDPASLVSPLLFAIMINWGLYGVLVLQTYIFYLASPLFPDDKSVAKVMVYTVLLLETAQTAISSWDVYAGIAQNFGSTTNLNSIQQHWLTVPIFGALTAGIGQFFFAFRIWSMTSSEEKGTPILIGVLGLASFGSGICAGVTFYNAGTFSDLINNDDNLAAIGVWNGFGSLCDIIIALSMPYYLMRNGTGLRSTHIKIVNLITLIIETGMLTAAIAILHFCLYFIKTPAFVVAGLTLSKLYGNTMLVILNNRIVNQRLRSDSLDFDGQPRSPAGRSVFTSARHPTRAATGGTSIIVTKDRLIFRLDTDVPKLSTKVDDGLSMKESIHTAEPIYGHAFSSETNLVEENDIAMAEINLNNV